MEPFSLGAFENLLFVFFLSMCSLSGIGLYGWVMRENELYLVERPSWLFDIVVELSLSYGFS